MREPRPLPAARSARFAVGTRREVGREARARLRRRMPTAIELVYRNANTLAIGFAASERASDVIVSLATYRSGVNLYFLYGVGLPDPHRVLQGKGSGSVGVLPACRPDGTRAPDAYISAQRRIGRSSGRAAHLSERARCVWAVMYRWASNLRTVLPKVIDLTVP